MSDKKIPKASDEIWEYFIRIWAEDIRSKKGRPNNSEVVPKGITNDHSITSSDYDIDMEIKEVRPLTKEDLKWLRPQSEQDSVI
jgi:hypothetical protein